MSIFAWLLLGHLIGDWMLQSDWMAEGKRKGLFTIAGVVHCGVYTAIILVVLMLAGVPPQHYLWIGWLIFVSHLIIDGTQIVDVWLCLLKQKKNKTLMRLMNDQALHLVVLAVVAQSL